MRLLSKSKIIAFRQCAKRLWLEIHRPDLREDSAGTVASFQVGHQVGDVAKRIYDESGTGAVIDVKSEGYETAFVRTAKLLAETRQPIFEAGFKAEGALAFADVMLPTNEDRVWRMVEVKSSTSVKDYHREDVAVQTFIAGASGVKLGSVALACINPAWVYPGGGNYRGLLAETDLTEEAFARTDEVKNWIAEAQRVAAKKVEPDVAMGDHCHSPFDCGFCNYCGRGQTKPEYPIDWLPRFASDARAKLSDQGVDDLRGVDDLLLNEVQLRVKRHTLDDTVFFDAEGAAADLAPHGFPAYFLDFESIQFAVPIWKGTRPYQQIPFQFSLHCLTDSGQLAHRAFLDLSGGDPSAPFARALIEAADTQGPIFVYNAAFECTRIRELVARFPEWSPPLVAIIDRVVDLLPVARKRYYHPAQKGSWSIKAVLPAAVPELSYEALSGVKDGGAAMQGFAEAINPLVDADRKNEIERQLLAYCRLDTFAMVRLWQLFSGRKGAVLQDITADP